MILNDLGYCNSIINKLTMDEHKSSHSSSRGSKRDLTFILVGYLGLRRMSRQATSWLQSNYSLLSTQFQSDINEENKTALLLIYNLLSLFNFIRNSKL